MIWKLLSFLTGGFLDKLLAAWTKREDTVAVQSTNAATATGALVQADVAHTAAIKDVLSVMMSHPVYWVAWGLGVFPVLLYHAGIYLVSTFPYLWLALTGIPAAKAILAVPASELQFGQTIVSSVFMLTGTSSLVAGLAHAWIKRA